MVKRSSHSLPAFEPPHAQLTSLRAGVVTGLPLVLLRSEGVALLAMAAVAYDLTHTYVGPAALGIVGLLTSSGLPVALALVWFAHIGMDRALGLGLQYPDGSGCTHLRVTRRGRADPGAGGELWTG